MSPCRVFGLLVASEPDMAETYGVLNCGGWITIVWLLNVEYYGKETFEWSMEKSN
jgi:hypothetical protein